ncbi:hypothetical protein GPECTOR_83g295 [Gonium pectorale]|uniref:K Homology domain-containing protein n=1 Tax=Gonium pectorale TaxID=33097 RepID=A0A150G1E2_GONPE|nr:hypothetical protein GPECTOR_83g295 [Gonium pectorale]|eukprot:KXZ43683.1 hypothetical protein GPECTOR_83g295 [Gonium pectorale]
MAYSTTVHLEGILSVGGVIGKGGWNVKYLGRQSGARFDVNDERVVISGHSQSAVQTARRLLQAQLDAHARLASPAYPHPLRVDYVLQDSGFGAGGQVAFRSRNDKQSRATGRREQLYVLIKPRTGEGDRFSRGGTSSGYGAEADALASLIGGISFRGRGGSGAASSKGKQATEFFHPGSILKSGKQGGPVARALHDAASTAARNTPAFDILKIRLNLASVFDQRIYLGPCAVKQLFFNLEGLEHRAEVALTDIQTLNVHYAVALTLSEGSSGSSGARVSLRKVKSSSTRCHFATLLAGPEGLDMRMKLVGQRRKLQASSGYQLRLKQSVVNLEDKDGRRAEIRALSEFLDELNTFLLTATR